MSIPFESEDYPRCLDEPGGMSGVLEKKIEGGGLNVVSCSGTDWAGLALGNVCIESSIYFGGLVVQVELGALVWIIGWVEQAKDGRVESVSPMVHRHLE